MRLPPELRGPRGRPGRALEVVLALVFLGGGVAKLVGAAPMVSLFAAIGVGQWFRLVVGVAELAGGLLLLSPVLAGVGAAMLTGVMVGAVATNVLVLRTSPLVPMIVLTGLVVVCWTRRAGLTALARRLLGVHVPTP